MARSLDYLKSRLWLGAWAVGGFVFFSACVAPPADLPNPSVKPQADFQQSDWISEEELARDFPPVMEAEKHLFYVSSDDVMNRYDFRFVQENGRVFRLRGYGNDHTLIEFELSALLTDEGAVFMKALNWSGSKKISVLSGHIHSKESPFDLWDGGKIQLRYLINGLPPVTVSSYGTFEFEVYPQGDGSWSAMVRIPESLGLVQFGHLRLKKNVNPLFGTVGIRTILPL